MPPRVRIAPCTANKSSFFRKLKTTTVTGSRTLAVLAFLLALLSGSVDLTGQLAEQLLDVIRLLRAERTPDTEDRVALPDAPRTFRNPLKSFCSSVEGTAHRTALVDVCKNRECHDYCAGTVTRETNTWKVAVEDAKAKWEEFSGATREAQCVCGRKRVTRRVLVDKAPDVLVVEMERMEGNKLKKLSTSVPNNVTLPLVQETGLRDLYPLEEALQAQGEGNPKKAGARRVEYHLAAVVNATGRSKDCMLWSLDVPLGDKCQWHWVKPEGEAIPSIRKTDFLEGNMEHYFPRV